MVVFVVRFLKVFLPAALGHVQLGDKAEILLLDVTEHDTCGEAWQHHLLNGRVKVHAGECGTSLAANGDIPLVVGLGRG